MASEDTVTDKRVHLAHPPQSAQEDWYARIGGKHARPQSVFEHGDDSPVLFLECGILFFCCSRCLLGVGKLLLQLHDTDSVFQVLLLSQFESLLEIVGALCQFFSVELAPALSRYCV
jgi:hypothetical protein